MKTIQLTINGESYEFAVEASETLLDVLRNKLDLTGTKRGCDMGVCGACTIIMDGEPVLSCTILAIRCNNRDIVTVEGLSSGSELHPLQQSAIEHHAVQCGFCTPGWLLSAKTLLDANPLPSRKEVQTAISGNLCRCTGYKKIEDAILAASRKSQKK